jgi:hypothetical protein
MTEVEQIQTIIIAKALYALHNIKHTVRKYKCQKRALNKIERTAEQALYEVDLVSARLAAAREKAMKTIR